MMQTQQAGREIQFNYILHQGYANGLWAELCLHVAHETAPMTPGVTSKLLGEANQNTNRWAWE